MIGKMEGKIIMGLLLANLCAACLPIEMREIDAAEEREEVCQDCTVYDAGEAEMEMEQGGTLSDFLYTDVDRYTVIDREKVDILIDPQEMEEMILQAGNQEKDIYISFVRNADGLLYTVQPDGTASVVGYDGEVIELEIPEMLEGRAVTRIENHAFEESGVTSVKLPSTLKEVGEYAFAGTPLVEIDIPDSVVHLEGGAFYGCKSLKKAVLGTGVTAITYALFSGCESLEELVLPEYGSLTEIQYYSMLGCNRLSRITFPDTIESCTPFAFDMYVEIQEPWYRNLPDGEVYIGKVFFKYKGRADAGTKIAVKPGTETIARRALAGQDGITEVSLPYGLKRMEDGAMWGVKHLTSIIIPSSVEEIGRDAVGYAGGFYVETETGSQYQNEKIKDFVICGEKGSAAETYAIENGFTFIEQMTYIKGDVNLSGEVDISDLRLMLRSVCEKVTLTGDQITAGDIAGQTNADEPDGKLTIADLRKLLRYICGKIEAL